MSGKIFVWLLATVIPATAPAVAQQPKKVEFIIDLQAAREIGLTIPPIVLVRADSVIK